MINFTSKLCPYLPINLSHYNMVHISGYYMVQFLDKGLSYSVLMAKSWVQIWDSSGRHFLSDTYIRNLFLPWVVNFGSKRFLRGLYSLSNVTLKFALIWSLMCICLINSLSRLARLFRWSNELNSKFQLHDTCRINQEC